MEVKIIPPGDTMPTGPWRQGPDISTRSKTVFPVNTIDLTTTNDKDEGPDPEPIFIDLTTDEDWIQPESPPTPNGKQYHEIRQRLWNAIRQPIGSHSSKNTSLRQSDLKPGVCVEFHRGMFMHIRTIKDNGNMTGRWLFHSTLAANVLGFLPQISGELIWLKYEHRIAHFQSVKGICNIVFTNARPKKWEHRKDLICRLALNIYDHETSATLGERGCVEYLTPQEADSRHSWAQNVLREKWRGEGRTVPLGEHELPPPLVPKSEPGQLHPGDQVVIDLDNYSPSTDQSDAKPVFDLSNPRERTYTFGDAFCGAGGVSCGARMAGLKIKWGTDMDKHAIATYQLNFHEDATFIEQSPFNDFMTNREEDIQVDICHASPPCQPFSPAHTIQNQVRDETNSACVFAPWDILRRVKPRVLTMEETSWLLSGFNSTLNRVVQDMIEIGYSARWGIVDCSHHGIPSTRKRLIVVAAGPGDTVPSFLPRTHGVGPGLLPVVTIGKAIDNIPGDTPNHDWEQLLAENETHEENRRENGYVRTDRPPYSKNELAKTLTTNGGAKAYHYSGKRRFTEREVACLQTFPIDFQFALNGVRRQVGNAVPPLLAKALYEHIAASLRATDKDEMCGRDVMDID